MNERSIFLDALALTDPDERRNFLDQACGVDQELRGQVEDLLVSHDHASSFLEKPPEGLVATIAAGMDETVGEPQGSDSLAFLNPTDKPGCLGTLLQYEVVEVVGRGGMGIVLRAYDTRLNRVVAIKVMAPELAASTMAVKRFLREARAAAAVSHEHVVTIHAIEEDNRPPFIVMEFIDGQSLQEKIDCDGALELNAILRVCMQMARGLEAAHEQGLVHRDIKPANILLENGVERVKLTDFGLARAVDDVSVTQTGQIAGTPQFMSPEQAQGQSLDDRSDLFSLGGVLYTMCTGRPPFRAETAVAMLRRVTDDEPRSICEVNSDIPDWLDAITFKLLAKDPSERFQSAAEVADLLSQHLAHLQHPATQPLPQRVAPPGPAGHLRDQNPVAGRPDATTNPARRRRLWANAGMGLLIFAMGLAFFGAIIHVVTDRGELIIEVDDPQIHVQISQDGRQVKILKEGDYRITMLPSGQYDIQVLGDSGDAFEISEGRLDISRGVKKVVTIRRKTARQRPEPLDQFAEVCRFPGHLAPVTEIVVLPSGKRFVSASVGKEAAIRLWDVASGALLAKTEPGTSAAHLAVSPDGTELASGRPNGKVEIWQIQTDAVVKHRELPSHGSVSDAIWTADGRFLVTFCSYPGRDAHEPARVYDTETWQRVCELDCRAGIFSAAAHPDGTHILFGLGGGRGLSLWNIKSGQVVKGIPIACNQLKGLAIDATGQFALSADNMGFVQLWNLAGGTLVKKFVGHGDNKLMSPVHAVDFHPSGKYIVSGGWDKTLRLWDIETGQSLARKSSDRQIMQVMAVLPDGKHVLTGGMDKTDTRVYSSDGDHAIRLWRLPKVAGPIDRDLVRQSVKPVRVIPHDGTFVTFTYLPDGTLVTSDYDKDSNRRRLYFLDDSALRAGDGIPALTSDVSQLTASGDGRWIAAACRTEHKVQLWDAQQRKLAHVFETNGMIHSVSMSPDSNLLAAASWDGVAKIWDVESHQLVKELGGYGRVHRVHFSLDGSTLAVSETPSGRTDLYETKTWTKRAGFRHGYGVGQMAFSPDGNLIAAGGNGLKGSEPWKMWVNVWDASSGELKMQFKEMQNAVSAVVISPDSRYLIAVGGNWGTDPDWGGKPHEAEPIRIWDLTAQRLVAEFEGHDTWVRDVAFAPDGKHFATAGMQEVKVWHLASFVGSESSRSRIRANSLGMSFTFIPGGSFEMGTADDSIEALPADEKWFFAEYLPDRREAERPRHKVTISRPFEMSEHEVTVGQFQQFIEATGYKTTAEKEGEGYGWQNGEWQQGPLFDWKDPGFDQTDDHPVCNVSWNDATEFCRWLSRQEGVTYRLPTEAEWEYACRAGTTTLFTTGDNPITLQGAANLADRSLRTEQPNVVWAVDWDDGFPTTAPVGSFRPNAFGLRDMHGNVWEWCQDVYDDEWYESSPTTDPVRRGTGRHVFRGGGFDNWPGFLRSADRYSSHSENIYTDWAGFRVVREVENASAKTSASVNEIPGIEVAFSKRVKRNAAEALIASIADGKHLWFYDEQYDSPSDPGAFVTLVRTDGRLVAKWRNHGWSTDWLPLADAKAISYLWACRKENTSGADNAINHVGMEIETARQLPTPDSTATGEEFERLTNHVEARIRSDEPLPEAKAQE